LHKNLLISDIDIMKAHSKEEKSKYIESMPGLGNI